MATPFDEITLLGAVPNETYLVDSNVIKDSVETVTSYSC